MSTKKSRLWPQNFFEEGPRPRTHGAPKVEIPQQPKSDSNPSGKEPPDSSQPPKSADK